MRALSIKQPYVELILRGIKPEECRKRKTNHRGPLLLHASKTAKEDQREEAVHAGIDFEGLPRGALLGVVDVVGCRETKAGFAWELSDARRFLKPIPYSGAVGIFLVDDALVSDAIAKASCDPEPKKSGLIARLLGRSHRCP